LTSQTVAISFFIFHKQHEERRFQLKNQEEMIVARLEN